MMKISFEVGAEEKGAKLGNFLRGRGVSLSEVRSLKFLEGGLLVNGKRARTCEVLQPGDTVCLQLPGEAGYSARPEALPLDILYESCHAMVVNKPAGQVVHPGPSHREGTLANAFCGWMEARGQAGIFRPVGRLDGGTSGLVVCAMNAAAAPLMGRTMQKEYWALAEGRLPPKGRIDAALGPVPDSAVEQRVSEAGRPSVTVFETLAAGAGASLVRVWPQTGRTHQIRVHLASVGHPLVGDALYGGGTLVMDRHALHCAQVRFTELGGKTVEVKAPVPEDMLRAAESLGLGQKWPGI